MSDSILQKKFSVPIQKTDLAVFDDAFSIMKERFDAEMKRIDVEMTRFNSDLMQIYGQSTAVATGGVTSKDLPTTNWETITSSPLVEGEGETKSLKLQYDVSQFDASEVKVKIVNDILVVSATHEEKSDKSMIYREYNREFQLPKGISPGTIVCSLSKDGILTVQAPLPQPSLPHAPLRIGSR